MINLNAEAAAKKRDIPIGQLPDTKNTNTKSFFVIRAIERTAAIRASVSQHFSQ